MGRECGDDEDQQESGVTDDQGGILTEEQRGSLTIQIVEEKSEQFKMQLHGKGSPQRMFSSGVL